MTNSAFRRASTDWRQRATWGMVIGLVTALVTLALIVNLPLGAGLEYNTLDLWCRLRGPLPSNDVAIIEVDEATVRRWGGRSFDAPDVGRLLRLLPHYHIRAAALPFYTLTDPVLVAPAAATTKAFAADLQASGVAHLPLGVAALPSTAAPLLPPAAAAILPKFAIGAPRGSLTEAGEPRAAAKRGGFRLQVPAPGLLAVAAGAGHLAFGLDSDGRARTLPLALPYAGRLYPALALSTVLQAESINRAVVEPLNNSGQQVAAPASRIYSLGNREIPVQQGAILLNYPYAVISNEAVATSPFSRVSLAAALKHPQILRVLRGKVVVIGPTAPGWTTLFTTPTGQRIPFVELHAIAIDNLLTGRALTPAPDVWLWLLTILLCMVVGGLVATRHPWWSGVVALLALAAVTTLSIGLFSQNIWLDIAAPYLGIGFTYLVGVIGRARRETREATRITSTIEALTQVSEVITAQTHSQQLLDRVLHWAENVMQATGASALLLDERDNMLHFAAATGPKASALLPFKLRLGEGIAGWVAQHGKPAIVNDALHDQRFAQSIDQRIGFSTHSVLCVPVRVRDKMLGVIEVINRRDGSPFSESDAELLMAVANQAAVVLENAQLYARLNQRVAQSESELEITNRHLEAERNLLHTVLQSMTNGIIVVDSEGVIQLINPAAAALLPELERDAKGRSLLSALPDFGASIQPTTPDMVTVELERGDIDALRLIEAHAAPLQSAAGDISGTVIVFDDVTEERKVEQMKSDFVSFVAHEMRSPLTSISGFSAMLQRSESAALEANGPSAAATSRARFLNIIHDESERLTRLINNLLDVARIEAGHDIELNRDEFGLVRIATQAAESQRGYSRRHQIKYAIDPDLPDICADRDKVTQILINLLSNALKYSPGGAVTIAAQRDGEWAWISVRDEGPGIAPEYLERLFQRFSRVGPRSAPLRSSGAGEKAKPTGTGLGLFLTKHLVETHGGRIWVESEIGRGATFNFTLPLAQEEDTSTGGSVSL